MNIASPHLVQLHAPHGWPPRHLGGLTVGWQQDGAHAAAHRSSDRSLAPSDGTPGQPGLRRAAAGDLPAIRAVIDAAYARYLTRMDKPPAQMSRGYGPLVQAGMTWVTGSPITAVLTLCPRDDHLYVENIAVDPSAQGRGLGRALMAFAEQQAARRNLGRMALVTHEAMTENQAIYARLGYAETGRRSQDGYRRTYMQKPLTGSPGARLPRQELTAISNRSRRGALRQPDVLFRKGRVRSGAI